MIRIILCSLFVGLSLVILIPVTAFFYVIRLFKENALENTITRIVAGWFGVILKLAGVKAEVIGEEKIPEDQAVLYIANHRSYFDVVFTGSRFKRPTGFIAKKEMEKAPLLSTWMRFIHCKFLDRKDIRQGLQVILSCIEDVKNGISIFIFPEGTRNKGEEGSLLPFHEGSFKVASKSGCPIVPVAISYSQDIWEAHMPRIKSTRIIVEYCDPVYPRELPKEEQKALGAYVARIIQGKLKEHMEKK